jgi:hypothetical protein
MKRLLAVVLGMVALAVWLPLQASAVAPVVDAGASADDGSADSFRVALNGANVDVTLNGNPLVSYPLAGLSSLTVQGSSDDDTLIVDSSGGLIALPGGIHFDGGNGFDLLKFVQSGGPTITSSRMDLGPSSGGGKSAISDGSSTQTVFFDNLEPVVDTVVAATATVDGTNSNNSINYSQGSVPANGLVSVDNFETYEFSNKTTLILDGMAGSDVFNLNNPTTPTALTGITVEGGDPSAGDTLIVNGIAGQLDNLRDLPTAAGAGTVVNDNAPQPNVTYTGLESLHLTIQHSDGDGVRVEGTTGNDKVKFFHGPTDDTGTFDGTMDTNNATGVGPFAMTEMTFSGASPAANDSDVNFFNPGGTDTFEFNGTAESDTIQVGSGEAGGAEFRNTLDGLIVSRVEVFNVAAGLVRGLGGDDVFNRTGIVPVPITFQGGSGSDDVLDYASAGNAATTVDLGAGTITSTGQGGTAFTGIESVNEFSSGGTSTLTVNGSAGSDAFGYTPTGANAGTVSLVGGPPVTFSGVGGSFTLDPLAGADTVSVNGTSGNDAISEAGAGSASAVQVGALMPVTLPNASTEALVISAGLGDDLLTVNSSGAPASIPTTYDGAAGLDSASITGSGAAMNMTFGTLLRVAGGAITQLNLQSVQAVSADTAGGALGIFGTGANDQFAYLPLGAASGQITRNGLLPQLDFSNAAGLTIDPLGGNDSVEVQGTSGDDMFNTQIHALATIQVGALLTVSVPTATTELLRLWGAAGNDAFNITTFNDASMNVAVDGDLPSVKKGDELTVFTTSKPVKIKKISTGKTSGIVNVDYKTGASVHVTHTGIETVKTVKI